TDVVKHVEMVESSSLMRFLNTNPTVISRNVEKLLQELEDLQCVRPLILAFGTAAHGLVAANVPTNAYSQLVKLTHYSHYMSKEDYKRAVLSELGDCDTGAKL